MHWRVGPSDLETIIATERLAHRPGLRRAPETETGIFVTLQRSLAREPAGLFQTLVESTLQLTDADSSGISLLNATGDAFVWPAIAGPLRRFVGDGTPREFSPCGTVLDREQTVLMVRPDRHFDYLSEIRPPLEEVLLIPFFVESRAVGTLWAVSHTPGREFTAEDRRLLEDLSTFAASAYQTLLNAGAIDSYLRGRRN